MTDNSNDTVTADAEVETTQPVPAEATPPVNITADEHQLLADFKATEHDLGQVLRDFLTKV